MKRDEECHPCIQLVAQALQCDPSTLSPYSQLYGHPHWDSLGQLKIILALEKTYGVTIDNERIQELTTMQGIGAACDEWNAQQKDSRKC